MPFINPDDKEIRITPGRETPFNPYEGCEFLSTEEIEPEGIKNFIDTEGGLLIEIDGTCQSVFLDCHELCRDTIFDSGSFTIINACTLPITITGFTVSDPERFSLVTYPKYKNTGVYPSGQVPELPLPFTLEPRKKKKINTFFHPFYEELEYGNAGTIIKRTGDVFGANVQFYPGFPILNCETENSCDASITLSGELICDDNEVDREWMKNDYNFTDPNPIPQDLQRIDVVPDPNQDLKICPQFDLDDYTYRINFWARETKSAWADFSFRLNSDVKWETKITVYQYDGEIGPNTADWAVGHQYISANQAHAWIVVPDGINNKTDYPIFFAQGGHYSSVNYSIHTYDGSFDNVEQAPSPPNGFIHATPFPETSQEDCLPL